MPLPLQHPTALPLTAEPAVAVDSAGKLHLLVRAADNAYYHASFDGQWRGFDPVPGTFASAPALCASSDGRLDAFGRQGNAIAHRRYVNGAWQGGWAALGGDVKSAPAAIARGSNRVDLFALGPNDSMLWRTRNGDEWTAWTSIGGVLASGPAVCSPGGDRLDVFARDAAGAIQHSTWNGQTWTGWTSLGGQATSDPDVVARDGRIELFVRGPDNGLWRRIWDPVTAQWSDWSALGGNYVGGAAAVSRGGQLDLFGVLADGSLLHQWSRDGASWDSALLHAPGTAAIDGDAVLRLDGSNGYVSLPAMNPDFSNGLTIEAWVRFGDFQTWSRIIDFGNGPSSDNIIFTNGTGNHLEFHICRDGLEHSVKAPGVLTTNVWTHVAVTLDPSGKARLYKDGVPVGVEKPDMPLPRNVVRTQCYIGKSNWVNDEYLMGELAEVRLWNHARRPDQIQGAMRRRLRGDEQGLIANWRLDDGSGVLARDAGPGRLADGGSVRGNLIGEATWTRGGLTLAAPQVETSVARFPGGENDQIQVKDFDIDLRGGFVVEAWVYPQADGNPAGAPPVFTMNIPGFGDFSLDASKTQALVYLANSWIPITTLQADRWTHLCAVVEPAGHMRCYKDGELVHTHQLSPAQSTANLSAPSTVTACRIGGSLLSRRYVGQIGEVRLWARTRSQAEIQSALRRRLTGYEPGLAGYWRLDERSGTHAGDDSPQARHGTRAGDCRQVAAYLPLDEKRWRVTSATHEGKVIVFATRPDGRVMYTVKQSGFEDTVPMAEGAVPDWETWKRLDLPAQVDDTSVLALEQERLAYNDDPQRFVLRSRYHTAADTAHAPVQVVSGFGHLYVFRQSLSGTLLVDRFVLDGMKNELVPKLEVRFKRSCKRHEPLLPPADGVTKDMVFDSLDFADTAGRPFYEPSTELCVVGRADDGLFAVALLPTLEADRQRWHFFVHNAATGKVEIVSILSSESGLFDPLQRTSPISGALLPGVERTELDLGPTAAMRSLCAVRYDLQEEQADAAGKKTLLRTGVRVMLVADTGSDVAALSFVVATDGTLARLSNQPTTQIELHSERREAILPLDTLENVKAARVDPPVTGSIAAMRRGDADKVVIETTGADRLRIGDSVQIKGTAHYNQRHVVTAVDADTFEIAVAFAGPELGNWEKVGSGGTGLTFDGAITSFLHTPDGKLRVTASNHGLVPGDAVQVMGTADYNSVYPVTPIDADRFALDAPWVLGAALGVRRLASRKRRGVGLSGNGQRIDVAGAPLPTGDTAYTVEAWIRPTEMSDRGILGWGRDDAPGRCTTLRLTAGGLAHGWGGGDRLTAATAPLTDGWHHVAATYVPAVPATDLQPAVPARRCLYLDGVLLADDAPASAHAVPAATDLTIGKADGDAHFSGALSEVRVWSVARTADQLSGAMFQQLNGQEDGLCGYWKLGTIAEGSPRKVFDFAPARRDGVVVGDVHVAGVTLARAEDTQYRNDDLIAVVRGGTYEESVEVRVVGGSAPKFKFAHWFKKSSDSVLPDATLSPIAATVTDLGDGWYRASCQFAVPAATSLMRAFQIEGPQADGPWTALELRRHRLIEIPAAITEWKYIAAPALRATSAAPATLDAWLDVHAETEQREAALLAERRVIADKIANADDPNRATKIAGLESQLAALKQQRAAHQTIRDQQIALRLPFYCRYVPVHSGMNLAVYGRSQSDQARVVQIAAQGEDPQVFYFAPAVPADGGHGFIVARHSGKVLDTLGHVDDGAEIVQNTRSDADSQRFYPVLDVVGGLVYKFRTKTSPGQVLDVRDGSNRVNESLIQYHHHGGTNQRFRLEIVDESPLTQPTKDALDDLDRRIAELERELADLRAAGTVSPEQRDKWDERIEAIDLTELPPLRTILAATSRDVLAALTADQALAPGLEELAEDRRKLVVRGALLPLVRAAGRITALQTCDGDVQLAYFDRRGRLREARYQATRDSSGTSFDAWRPTAARAALHFTGPGDAVELEPSIALGEEWTVEAWFQAPLPRTASGNTLLLTPEGEAVVVVGDKLGSRLGQLGFRDCGFDVRHLPHGWHHLAAVASGGAAVGDAPATSTITFYIDGERVGDLRSVARVRAAGDQAALTAIDGHKLKLSSTSLINLGNHSDGGQQFGRVAEVRVWSVPLKAEEIAANSRVLLTGREPGLLAYFPLTEGHGSELRDITGNGHRGLVGTAAWIASGAPIGRHAGETRGEAVAVAEYDTIGLQPGGLRRIALMRRAFAVEAADGVRLLADQRIEELDLRWVGNAQFQPTLLGYIEGPPPVPGENLTLSQNYDGAAAVELTTDDDVSFQWNRTKDAQHGSASEAFLGVDTEVNGIFFGWTSDIFKMKIGFTGALGGHTGETHSSTVSAQSSLKMADRLELRGTFEDQPRFPQLGNRFIPKNVGYALVVSGLADVFITRLKRSGRMIGYEVVPNLDIPPDVNTISFLINPAYTMTGSLDGMTGSAPTSERFFAHVPELRAQYGSRYPASYYRLTEAYELKRQIERQDKDREAYFFNFDAKLKTLGPAGDVELDRRIDDGEVAGVTLDRQEDRPPPSAAASEDPQTPPGVHDPAADEARDREDDVAARKAQIEKAFADREHLYSATRGLEEWQARMENLRVRAGKRNIVNTYVWDANGGLHTEQQQFASSVVHSIGSSASVNFSIGAVINVKDSGAGWEFTSLYNMQMSQTLTKTVATSRGFGLNVSLSGVESRGVTDHKDRPLNPGEKVGRYRFMSFYLEGAESHFNDFFSYVVDPEWLAGNSESARALRQAKGRTNKAWRVLHRVTYVERPALANFGADLRPLAPTSAPPPPLDKRVDGLEQKLDLILKLLQTP